MSVELLSQLGDKDRFERFSGMIKKHTVTPEVWSIMTDMKVWWEKRDTLKWDEFGGWYKLRHPKLSPEQAMVYDKVFNRLHKEEFDDLLVEDVVQSFVKRDFAMKTIELADKIAAGDEDTDVGELEQLLTEYYAEVGMVNDLDTYEVTNDLDQLIAKSETGGYNWKLPFLNKSIGSCRKGKLYVVGARPNSGKTTLLSQEYMHIAQQLPPDHVALWFNNEEDGFDVKWRHWEALLEAPKESIEANPIKAKAKIEQMIGSMSKVVLVDKANVSMNDVHAYLKKYDGRVGLIIFDQLHKIKGFEKMSSTDVDRLTNQFNWAREVAKRYAPVITSHQLGKEAEGVATPPMSTLYGSSTAIQGEADVIIMLGYQGLMGLEDERHISIQKVKGAYGPYVDRQYRNGTQAIILEADRARFVEPK